MRRSKPLLPFKPKAGGLLRGCYGCTLAPKNLAKGKSANLPYSQNFKKKCNTLFKTLSTVN